MLVNMLKLRISFSRIMRRQCTINQIRHCSSDSRVMDEEKQKELDRISQNPSIDEPPTSCCQSGCSNCVFIVWAEALEAKMQQSPEIAEKILKMVEDPSMKAYLEMELRLRGLKKQ